MRSTVSPHTYPIKFQFILSLVLTAIALAGGVSCDSEQKRIEHSALALCDSLDKLAESADAEIGVATWEALRDNALDSLARARRDLWERLSEQDPLGRIAAVVADTRDSATLRRLTRARQWALSVEVTSDTALSRISDSLRLRTALAGRNTVQRFRIDDSLNSARFRRQAFADAYRAGEESADWAVRYVRLLNQRAQSFGYRSYLALQLELGDVPLELLTEAITALDSLTRPDYRELLDSLEVRYHTRQPGAADVYFYANHGPDSIQRILATLSRSRCVGAGLGVVRTIGVRTGSLPLFVDTSADASPISAPRVIGVNVPSDVRLPLGPLDQPADLDYLSGFATSLGAALALTQPHGSHYLQQTQPSRLWTSALGMLVEELTLRQDGLAAATKARPAQLAALQRWLLERRQILLRQELLDATFEIEMFDNPYRDLVELYQKLYRSFMIVEPPKNIARWSDLFWQKGPESLRCETVIGEMIVAQILSHGRREFGDIANSEKFGEFFLSKYCAPGGTEPWSDILLQATGERLNPQYLYAQLMPLETSGSE